MKRPTRSAAPPAAFGAAPPHTCPFMDRKSIPEPCGRAHISCRNTAPCCSAAAVLHWSEGGIPEHGHLASPNRHPTSSPGSLLLATSLWHRPGCSPGGVAKLLPLLGAGLLGESQSGGNDRACFPSPGCTLTKSCAFGGVSHEGRKGFLFLHGPFSPPVTNPQGIGSSSWYRFWGCMLGGRLHRSPYICHELSPAGWGWSQLVWVGLEKVRR